MQGPPDEIVGENNEFICFFDYEIGLNKKQKQFKK